ncbi:uncharacterized protein [Venturia canescens]|uniref:uncharacterized protein isoform X2 n=1 Tax=Venturia canescens TaxID=32260 RepID=UPI001C9D475A|nr:uncharacterized protein LOC122405576 isoform X2 [Venturia canescens]
MAPGRVETTYVPEVEEHARREQERRVVQEGTAVWRRRKEELQRQRYREQRELRQMQMNYSPWGKPGGGAPYAGSMRKKNVLLEPLDFAKTCGYTNQLAQPTSPWGRPGPGGVPWRDPKLLGVRFRESMGWTSGSLIARLRDSKTEIDPLAPVDTNTFFDNASRPAPDLRTDKSNVDGDDGINRDARKNDYREEVQVYKLTGGVELVPLLTRYHYSPPHGSRFIATDATRPGYVIDSLRALNVGNRDHITALAEQIRRKRETVLEERRLEQESCRRHFDTWRRLWGRPGHGAPLDHAQRNDLYDILYRSAVY